VEADNAYSPEDKQIAKGVEVLLEKIRKADASEK
jgi:hypothetical protein